MAANEAPLCKICQPPRRHWKGERHKFGGPEPAPAEPSPRPRVAPLSGSAKAKVVDGLREAILVAKGVAQPVNVTVVLRGREKQAAYMRDYRKRVRERAKAREQG